MVSPIQCACRLLATVTLIIGAAEAFVAAPLSQKTTLPGITQQRQQPLLFSTPWNYEPHTATSTSLYATRTPEDNESIRFFKRIRRRISPRRLIRKAKPISFAILTLFSLRHNTPSFFGTEPAHASAPLPAMPQMQEDDLEGEALKQKHNADMAQYQQEMQQFQQRAKQIQETQGDEARAQFEANYKAAKQEEARIKSAQIEQLKRDLYNQGISPVYDLEGERQVTLLETGVDLAEVAGTRFYAEKTNIARYPERSEAYQKRAHRFILKERVNDLKRRSKDPLQHFERTREDARILDMPNRKALALQKEYMENLQKYGQITVPVKGEVIMTKEELAAKEQAEEAAKAAAAAGSSTDSKAAAREARAKAREAKNAARAQAREAKALAREKKAEARALAKEEKAKLRQEKAKAKEDARAAKAAAAAAAATAAASAAAQGAGAAVSAGVDAAASEIGSSSAVDAAPIVETETRVSAPVEESSSPAGKKVSKTKSGKLPIVPAASVVVAAAGGGYAIKSYQEKAAADEAERQRQFKLLMGDDDDEDDFPSWSAPALEVETDLTEESESSTAKSSSSKESAPPPAEQPKKRKLGIKSVFSKKSNGRETDINKLVAPNAKAPEFATLLAKVLSLGAPGRFPQVQSLPGGMPMEEFDLNATKELLEESMSSSDIDEKVAAEVFADVTNCMMIDIVDLASSALKERDDKVTVSAINVVIDFMNHAAAIFMAILEGVEITPVTYGGTLGKGKLEQMYRKYAESAQSEGNLQLLKDVFEITDKKAQGIEQKIMMKQMMDMMKGMKNGEVPPQMKEMMESMGGLGGLEGLANMEGLEDMDIDMEQLKTMLQGVLDMKEAGLIPEEELKTMKTEVKTLLGGLKDETATLTPEEKEVEELMNKIFSD